MKMWKVIRKTNGQWTTGDQKSAVWIVNDRKSNCNIPSANILLKTVKYISKYVSEKVTKFLNNLY